MTRWIAGVVSCAAAIAMLVFGQAFYRQRVMEIETALQEGRKLRADGRFSEAMQTLARGLDRTRAVPGVENLTHSLQQQHLLAQRGQKAAALHELADLIRFRHGIELPAPEEARALIKSIRAVWNERDLLLGTPAESLDARSEQVIRTDLLDLAIVAAELRLGLAPPAELDAARRDVAQLVDFAAAWCGPNPRLDRFRQATPGGPVQPAAARTDDPAVLSTLDHYDQGRVHLRAGRFREASVDFQRVLDERPQDFWSNFYQGLCAYRLGQFHDALAAFRICIALAPNSAECYYNRARVAEALGHAAEAVRDYNRALELDPALTSATINRGILAYRNGRNDDAIADFHQAIRGSSDSRTLGMIHYNLALAHLARGDRAAALASAGRQWPAGMSPRVLSPTG